MNILMVMTRHRHVCVVCCLLFVIEPAVEDEIKDSVLSANLLAKLRQDLMSNNMDYDNPTSPSPTPTTGTPPATFKVKRRHATRYPASKTLHHDTPVHVPRQRQSRIATRASRGLFSTPSTSTLQAFPVLRAREMPLVQFRAFRYVPTMKSSTASEVYTFRSNSLPSSAEMKLVYKPRHNRKAHTTKMKHKLTTSEASHPSRTPKVADQGGVDLEAALQGAVSRALARGSLSRRQDLEFHFNSSLRRADYLMWKYAQGVP